MAHAAIVCSAWRARRPSAHAARAAAGVRGPPSRHRRRTLAFALTLTKQQSAGRRSRAVRTPATVLTGQSAMSGAPISVALVGAGDIFSHHAAGMLAHPELYTVSCVCDPDKTRVAAASERCGGCPTFPTLTEALKADSAVTSTVSFEAVVLMIPHHLHESIALQAFSAKKHTLLEKPLATTVDACRRILAAAEQSGVVFAVAENAQFIPDFVKAKQLIDSGAIGDVYFCKANLWESAIESEFADGFAQGWRSDLEQAGAFALQGSIR